MNQTVKPELKAAYFAQYWGQKVWIVALNGDSFVQKVCASYMTKYSLENRCLLLTPLDQITDEDAMKAAEIAGYNLEGCEHKQLLEKILFLVKRDYEVVDFLRSRGYALPWNGHSVQQLIEAGYMKLREGGNGEP